ncbi:MAG TPA: DHH family phosphoesterase [Acidimicrobiia bacterium]|jgi:phosphoesterase RecJ-like protein
MADIDAMLEEAAALIGDAGSIATIGHVGPDGDALGSALALALAARAAGKDAWATFGEPFVVPSQFDYLDQSPLVRSTEVPRSVDVAIVCDVAAEDRLGSAAPVAAGAGRVVVVDHHASNAGFGDCRVIDPAAAATAVLAYRLIAALGWPMTRAVADALYTGLVTDTGRFQYSATSPDDHRMAADLLEAGVRPEVIGRHVYEEAPFGYLSVAGAVLARAQLDADRRLVWSVLLQNDLTAGGIAYEEADGLIDLIRIAEESEVACLLREVGGGAVKGSLRSRGAVDVGSIAAALGGGGHHNAAGFTVEGSIADAIEQVRARL